MASLFGRGFNPLHLHQERNHKKKKPLIINGFFLCLASTAINKKHVTKAYNKKHVTKAT